MRWQNVAGPSVRSDFPQKPRLSSSSYAPYYDGGRKIMAIKTTQNERIIQLSTPLEKDYLLIERLRCTEGLNQLFRIDLEILHEEQIEGFEPTAVDPQKLLGNPMV